MLAAVQREEARLGQRRVKSQGAVSLAEQKPVPIRPERVPEI